MVGKQGLHVVVVVVVVGRRRGRPPLWAGETASSGWRASERQRASGLRAAPTSAPCALPSAAHTSADAEGSVRSARRSTAQGAAAGPRGMGQGCSVLSVGRRYRTAEVTGRVWQAIGARSWGALERTGRAEDRDGKLE